MSGDMLVSEQAMKTRHVRSMVAPGHNWRQCEDCAGAVPWPCDAALGRAALERIEKKAEGWRENVPLTLAFGAACQTLREIRDEARTALGEQQP